MSIKGPTSDANEDQFKVHELPMDLNSVLPPIVPFDMNARLEDLSDRFAELDIFRSPKNDQGHAIGGLLLGGAAAVLLFKGVNKCAQFFIPSSSASTKSKQKFRK